MDDVCPDFYQIEGSEECRYNMVDWCYRMLDFCNFHRDTAAIAMNFVDRFVMADEGQLYLRNQTLYQLLVVTALYTAIKVHESQSIDLQSLSNVSRGTYSVKRIKEVESQMVDALQWRLNPPTAMSFVQILVDLIPCRYVVSAQVKERILKLSRVQAENALYDHELVEIKTSTIGYCSLINALRIIIDDHAAIKHVTFVLAQVLQIRNIDAQEVAQVQSKLYWLLESDQSAASSELCDDASNIQIVRPCVQQHTKESPRSSAL